MHVSVITICCFLTCAAFQHLSKSRDGKVLPRHRWDVSVEHCLVMFGGFGPAVNQSEWQTKPLSEPVDAFPTPLYYLQTRNYLVSETRRYALHLYVVLVAFNMLQDVYVV